jgi:hypothetical protein
MQPGSVLAKSESSRRRYKRQAFDVIKEKFNCDDNQASEIAQLVCTPHIGALKSTKDTPPNSSSSQISQQSQLRTECLEKVLQPSWRMRKDTVRMAMCIKHRHSGCIITSQFKAWNDTVRMAMYIDLILKPLAEQRPKK